MPLPLEANAIAPATAGLRAGEIGTDNGSDTARAIEPAQPSDPVAVGGNDPTAFNETAGGVEPPPPTVAGRADGFLRTDESESRDMNDAPPPAPVDEAPIPVGAGGEFDPAVAVAPLNDSGARTL